MTGSANRLSLAALCLAAVWASAAAPGADGSGFSLSWRDGGAKGSVRRDGGVRLEFGSRQLWVRMENSEIDDGVSSEAGIRLWAAWTGDPDGDVVPADSAFRELAKVTRGIDGTGANIWRVTREGATLTVSGGNRGLSELARLETPPGKLTGYTFFTKKKPWEARFVTYSAEAPAPWVAMGAGELRDRIENPSDAVEGEWAVFDMALDERVLRTGGDYRLAVVKEKEGYRLVYLSGAEKNPGSWSLGMTKGLLLPTAWEGVWNVVWNDADHRSLSHDVKAQLTEPGVIEIQFPYQDSKVRLRKSPASGGSSSAR